MFKTCAFLCSPRLSDTQECLESSLIEKENTLAQTSEKLELISSLQESLCEKEIQHKDVSDKLLHAEHNVSRQHMDIANWLVYCTLWVLTVIVTMVLFFLTIAHGSFQKIQWI